MIETEQTHYRTIPELEYQELKALAEGNKRAIENVMNDSTLLSELREIEEKLKNIRSTIKDFSYYFKELFDAIECSELHKESFMLRYCIRGLKRIIK